MTREEAIGFGNIWLQINEDCKDSSTYAFFHIAIEELKREPVLDKIRTEIEQLPTQTKTNWNGCCPDFDYPEIEYVDVTKKELLEIIDKYKAERSDKE